MPGLSLTHLRLRSTHPDLGIHTSVFQPTTSSHRMGKCTQARSLGPPRVVPSNPAARCNPPNLPNYTKAHHSSGEALATAAPAHTSTAVARLGIKIACDLATLFLRSHVPAPYPASLSSHMTRSVRGVPCSKFQRRAVMDNVAGCKWAAFCAMLFIDTAENHILESGRPEKG